MIFMYICYEAFPEIYHVARVVPILLSYALLVILTSHIVTRNGLTSE